MESYTNFRLNNAVAEMNDSTVNLLSVLREFRNQLSNPRETVDLRNLVRNYNDDDLIRFFRYMKDIAENPTELPDDLLELPVNELMKIRNMIPVFDHSGRLVDLFDNEIGLRQVGYQTSPGRNPAYRGMLMSAAAAGGSMIPPRPTQKITISPLPKVSTTPAKTLRLPPLTKLPTPAASPSTLAIRSPLKVSGTPLKVNGMPLVSSASSCARAAPAVSTPSRGLPTIPKLTSVRPVSSQPLSGPLSPRSLAAQSVPQKMPSPRNLTNPNIVIPVVAASQAASRLPVRQMSPQAASQLPVRSSLYDSVPSSMVDQMSSIPFGQRTPPRVPPSSPVKLSSSPVRTISVQALPTQAAVRSLPVREMPTQAAKSLPVRTMPALSPAQSTPKRRATYQGTSAVPVSPIRSRPVTINLPPLPSTPTQVSRMSPIPQRSPMPQVSQRSQVSPIPQRSVNLNLAKTLSTLPPVSPRRYQTTN